MPALAEPPRTHAAPSNGSMNGRHASAPAPALEAERAPEVSFEELIFDYLTISLPLPALARRHRMTMQALADVLESEPAQTLIRRMTRLAAQRARVLAVHNRASALASLETTVATTDNPETARKAAATLIRASDRVLYPSRRRRAANRTTIAQSSTPTGDPAAPDTRATQINQLDASSAPPGGRLCGEGISPPSEPRPRRSSSGAG